MKRTSRGAAVVSGLTLAMVATVGFAPTASAVAYDPANPVATAWVPDGPVHAVVATASRVYVGGSFTGGVAALDASTGERIDAWQGSTNGDVRALAMSPDGTHVLAGGAFTQANGATHKKLASFATTDGSVDSTWKAAAGGTVRDIVVSGDTMYFGGAFVKHDGVVQQGLGAALVSTGKPVPGFTPATDGNVYALSLSGDRLVFAGNFTHVTGTSSTGTTGTFVKNSMGSVNVTTSRIDDWTPVRACSACNVYWDLAVSGSTAYVATRNAGALTAYNLAATNKLWTIPGNGDAQAVTVSGTDVYVGGHFTAIGGNPRTILAKISVSGGGHTFDPAFNPRFVTTYPGIWALASTSTRLDVGGHFTASGPTPNRHPYLAIFQP
jgi:Domain of unknown function (DUF5122) beta-propeller